MEELHSPYSFAEFQDNIQDIKELIKIADTTNDEHDWDNVEAACEGLGLIFLDESGIVWDWFMDPFNDDEYELYFQLIKIYNGEDPYDL